MFKNAHIQDGDPIYLRMGTNETEFGTNETGFGYNEALATKTMRALPRFGLTTKFALLFGNEDQQTDYVCGLLFAGVFILIFFILWVILIAIFSCGTRERYGFLSGHPFQVPRESKSKRPFRIRITFMIAAIILVVFSVLLVTKGLTQIKDGVSSVYDSALEVNNIIIQAQVYINNVRAVANEAVSLRDDLVAKLQNDFCPASDLGAVTARTGINFSAVVQNLNTLSEFGNFTNEDIDEIDYIWNTTQSTIDDAEKYSEDVIETSDWQSLIFLISFPLFCTILVAAVVFASCQRSSIWLTSIITWIVLPLFFVLIITCWVSSSIIVITASANADFCSGGDDNTPGSSIKEIMEVLGYKGVDLVYRVIEFYVGQCTRVDPYVDLGDYENKMAAGRTILLNFDVAIRNITIEGLVEVCGERDFQSVEVIARALAQRATLLVASVEKILDLLSCENIIPIYTNAFWDGTCQSSVTGVTWSFSSFLVIGVMGMLMFTFRAACRPTETTGLHDKFSHSLIEQVDNADEESDSDRRKNKNSETESIRSEGSKRSYRDMETESILSEGSKRSDRNMESTIEFKH